MNKLILLIFLSLVSSLSVMGENKAIEDAIDILHNSNNEESLLKATKTIVDSVDKKAWIELVSFLNNKELMLKIGKLAETIKDPTIRQIYPTYHKYFDVIISSENDSLLDFLKILGSSPEYMRNRDMASLFSYNLKRFKNKDDVFYSYIISLYEIKSGHSIKYNSLQEILIASGQERYHHFILEKNGYTPGQVVFGKEVKIEDFYNKTNLAALARYRNNPYNFQVLVNRYLTTKEDPYLDYILDDKEAYKDSMTLPFCAELDPKMLEDCKAIEKALLSLKRINEGAITTPKLQGNLNEKLKKIQAKIEKLESEK